MIANSLDLPSGKLLSEAYNGAITPEQGALIVQAASAVGGNPLHLARVMWHESRFNPKAQYGYVYGPPGDQPLPGRATGLIQFVPSTAAKLGTTTAALYAMPFAQQMDYVKKYLTLVAAGEWAGPAGLLDTQAKMALAVFYPAYRELPLDTPLSAEARADNPGIRTIGDYVNRVMGGRALAEHRPAPSPKKPTGPDGMAAGAIALAFGLGLVAFIMASGSSR